MQNKLKCPLPVQSTLKIWFTSYVFSLVVLQKVLLILKNNANTSIEFDNLAGLSFDEMSLRKEITFNWCS